MTNRYRLSSSTYEREEENKIEPKKVFFLSVEGNTTEKAYFQGVSSYRKQLGISAEVNVEVLRRSSKDTNSAPQQVIELLEEYIRLRNTENIESDIPKDLIKENKKISNAHTYVSAELSKIAGHGKSKIRFKENFFA